MPTHATDYQIDGGRVAEALEEALPRVAGASGELSLDFSSVTRLDAAALGVLEKLAAEAEAKGVKIVLIGVRVDVYKVLKLLKLAPRLGFAG